MPETKYINLYIDDKKVDLEELDALPVSISYQLEDAENFQKKKGNQSFNISAPATLNNDKIFNTFHNPSVEDLSTGQANRSHRSCRIEGNGEELLNGKSFLISGSHTDKPNKYEFNCYGGNADWLIDMKELTLYEVLKDIQFVFSKQFIEDTWQYDGRDETMPFVFAPAKYGNWLDENVGDDNNVTVGSMKTALSAYWVLYRGFKLFGYKLKSNFFDTDLFRRLVMPWVWGNFLSVSGSKYDIHLFNAKSARKRGGGSAYVFDGSFNNQYVDCKVSNDNSDGMFDNNTSVPNGDYQYIPGNQFEMQWKYNTPHFGLLEVTFSMIVDTFCFLFYNSTIDHYIDWFVNGTLIRSDQIVHLNGLITAQETGLKTLFFTTNVNPNDTVSARVKVSQYKTKIGSCSSAISIKEFKIDYFRIPLGGIINFDAFNGFKKVKFLDCLAGFVDAFDLSFSTDAVNKEIVIEPTHDNKYSKGYFNGDHINWDGKQDLSNESVLSLFSDYEREVTFKFQDDANDGLYKLVQDRNTNKPAAGKYVFPGRFQEGAKTFENRFFSAVMHYEASQFIGITGVAPQLVTLVPENISNTSRSESQNTFAPKLCYYKGLVTGSGGWKFEGTTKTDLPFMFAVNYKVNGAADPVLSYCDEKIGTTSEGAALGEGLLKTFFWPRLAIMRNGQYYNTNLLLNNKDASRPHNREFKIIDGQKWELIEIKNYYPLKTQSTACSLRKWVPVSKADYDATFPSMESVLNDDLTANSLDIKYCQLKCLPNDIPKPK